LKSKVTDWIVSHILGWSHLRKDSRGHLAMLCNPWQLYAVWTPELLDSALFYRAVGIVYCMCVCFSLLGMVYE
jgi:hypothetical protein